MLAIPFDKVVFYSSTGKDDACGPTLPKTPSTTRRLRSRQQRKRKQEDDGSPRLPRTLRSTTSKQKRCVASTDEMVTSTPDEKVIPTPDETKRPFDDISNKDQTISTVKRSSRQCAKKATDAIARSIKGDRYQQEVKVTPPCKANEKPESTSDVCQVTTIQKEPEPESQMETDQAIVSSGCTPCVNLAVPTKHTPPPSESSPDTMHTPTTVTKEHCAEDHVITPSTVTKSDSSAVVVTPATIMKVTSKSSSPTVAKHIVSPDPKPDTTNDIRRVTTIIKKEPEPLTEADQIIVNSGYAPCINLAELTKLTPPPPEPSPDTPTTVIKESCTEDHVIASSTVTKNDSNAETPATITKVAFNDATVTKDNANHIEGLSDGSPDLGVTKPQDNQVGMSGLLSGTTTKKQITPNSAFSPAKLKVKISVL